MTLMYLGFYTLALAIIWGFFLVARIHAYKFKNFSTNITRVSKILIIILIVLSLLGYLVILFGADFSSISSVDFGTNSFDGTNY